MNKITLIGIDTAFWTGRPYVAEHRDVRERPAAIIGWESRLEAPPTSLAARSTAADTDCIPQS